jgi:hypothetical protein
LLIDNCIVCIVCGSKNNLIGLLVCSKGYDMSKIVPLFTSAALPPLSECIIEGENRLVSRIIYGVVVIVGVAMYGRKAF